MDKVSDKVKWPVQWNILTHKQLETHGGINSTAATDALVLKHQGISKYD